MAVNLPKRVNVRMSESESIGLTELAKRRKQTVSQYLRTLIKREILNGTKQKS